MTDDALMLEVSNNDLDSASVLFDRYSKRLYNYFVKISLNKELGHDLMQNTFLRMIKYRSTYKEGRAFETWIFQIARNVFADYLKKNKLMFSDHVDVYQMDRTSEEYEQQERLAREHNLQAAMAKLEDESREILILSRYQGMKYEQIANLLNITVPSVKVKVHRAIKKLRTYYVEIEQLK